MPHAGGAARVRNPDVKAAPGNTCWSLRLHITFPYAATPRRVMLGTPPQKTHPRLVGAGEEHARQDQRQHQPCTHSKSARTPVGNGRAGRGGQASKRRRWPGPPMRPHNNTSQRLRPEWNARGCERQAAPSCHAPTHIWHRATHLGRCSPAACAMGPPELPVLRARLHAAWSPPHALGGTSSGGSLQGATG